MGLIDFGPCLRSPIYLSTVSLFTPLPHYGVFTYFFYPFISWASGFPSAYCELLARLYPVVLLECGPYPPDSLELSGFSR